MTTRVASRAFVLAALWNRRYEKRPTVLVIDKAHNICPPDPSTELEAKTVERLVQIATEGRKFGLWLVLATQRPSRIHRTVLSQCDNLVLMRVNSPTDLRHVSDVFGFAPPAMLASASWFTTGEALIAGAFTAAPTIAKLTGRVTPEAGADVAVPLPGE